MSPNEIPGTERETLSALFDGELQADARRFAMRRLEHDASWKDDCGRWQLIGDVMRKQAPIAAPGDFAGRVRDAVAVESIERVAKPAESAVPARGRRRVWTGAALAASVAMLAVFATRSLNTGAPAAAPAVAVAPVVGVPQPAASVASMDIPAAAPAAAPALPAPTAVDRAPAELRAATRIAAAQAVTGRVGRGSTVSSAPRDTRSVAAAATFAPPDASNPFHVPATDPLATRPWPRAALPGGTALTASYGTEAGSSGNTPSFYPFEPRTHADADIRAEAP